MSGQFPAIAVIMPVKEPTVTIREDRAGLDAVEKRKKSQHLPGIEPQLSSP
jgi:hypothetical protein